MPHVEEGAQICLLGIYYLRRNLRCPKDYLEQRFRTPNVYEPTLNYFRMRWFQSDENFTIYWRKPDAWYSDGDNNRWCVKDDKGRWRPFIVEPDD
jgi:hypothetical protein